MRFIRTDDFDEMAWQEALEASPTLARLQQEGQARCAAIPDALADMFQLLLQPFPRWMPPTRPTLAEHVLRELEGTQEFRSLRAFSEADPVSATLATGIMGRRVLARMDDRLANGLEEEGRLQERSLEAQAKAEALAEVVDSEDGELVAALQEQADAIAALPDPSEFDEALGRMRREARQAANEAAQDLDRLREAELVLGGRSAGTLEEKLRLAERLERSSVLAQLVQMAGRIKRIALQKRASIIKEARGAIVGVTLGDGLERILPSELALLASDATRPWFFKKLIERQLLVHEQRDEEVLGGGPILICLDGSGSMAGTRETWSKAVALAYLAIAERERRDMAICQFGGTGQQHVLSFPYRTDPRAVRRDQVIEAVEVFLDASATDLEGALRWAASQVAPYNGRYAAADIVVLTDAEVTFSQAFLEEWRATQRKLEFRTFGVLIGAPESAEVLARATEHVTYVADLADGDRAIEDLFGHAR